ncbi:MAG: DUF3568 family protein [Puniceicoccaceae bacterium]
MASQRSFIFPLVPLSFAAILVFLSGCIAAAAGGAAGTVAYLRGGLSGQLEARHHLIYRAILESVEAKQFTLLEENLDGLSARVVARSEAADKKITYTVKPMTAGVSTMMIRIGVLGDENLSRLLFDDVRQRLNLR